MTLTCNDNKCMFLCFFGLFESCEEGDSQAYTGDQEEYGSVEAMGSHSDAAMITIANKMVDARYKVVDA